MPTRNTRRQVATILMNRYLENKNYTSMIKILGSGVLNGEESRYVNVVDRVGNVFKKYAYLDAIGIHNIPKSMQARPIIAEWIHRNLKKWVQKKPLKDMKLIIESLDRRYYNALLHQVYENALYCKTELQEPEAGQQSMRWCAYRPLVDMLIARGANINSEIDKNTILMTLAFSLGKYLGKKHPGTREFERRSRAFRDIVSHAVKSGLDVKRRVTVRVWGTRNNIQGTMMHHAVYLARAAPLYGLAAAKETWDILYNLYTSYGVGINESGSNGITALHLLALYLKKETIPEREILLSNVLDSMVAKGALYDLPNHNGKTARDMLPNYSFVFKMADVSRQGKTRKKRKPRSTLGAKRRSLRRVERIMGYR